MWRYDTNDTLRGRDNLLLSPTSYLRLTPAQEAGFIDWASSALLCSDQKLQFRRVSNIAKLIIKANTGFYEILYQMWRCRNKIEHSDDLKHETHFGKSDCYKGRSMSTPQ